MSAIAPRIVGTTGVTARRVAGTTGVIAPRLAGTTGVIAPRVAGTTDVIARRIAGTTGVIAPRIVGTTSAGVRLPAMAMPARGSRYSPEGDTGAGMHPRPPAGPPWPGTPA